MQWADKHTFKTEDGYEGGFCKLDGVSLDGYMATVMAPGWSYGGRFSTPSKAKQWCEQTVRRDRVAPLQRADH